jgi:signal transduction histidine kinase
MRTNMALLGPILEALLEPVVVTDARRRIRLVNQKALTVFGHRREELLGRPVDVILPAAISGGQRFGRRKDGSDFPGEVRGCRVRSSAGSLEIVCIHEVTATSLDPATRHTERVATFGLLATEVAHEARNALGILASRIDLMLLEADETGLPAVARDLAVLQRAAQRLTNTFERLLAYAPPPQRLQGPVDVGRVIAKTLALLERPLAYRGIRVETDLDPLLPAMGDAEMLQETLVNLILNARDAMTNGGELRLEARFTSDRTGVRLVVADNGPGLPAEVRGHIGQPFTSTKARERGHGLASVCRSIRAHGATVEVQSEPGRGTSFILTFPAGAADDQRDSGGGGVRAAPTSLRAS